MKPTVAALALAAAVLCATGASAAPPLISPTPEEFNAVRPTTAAPGTAGRAVMICKARADGSVDACRLVMESPIGAGFGQALLSLAPKFRAPIGGPGGNAPGDEILIPGDWEVAQQQANWLRKPSAGELMSVWPTEALKHGTGGKATIHCLVSLQGALFDCKVASETPPGAHFGEAALALAPQFLMKPATRGGQPVVSSVNVPITFTPSGYRPDVTMPLGKPVVSANLAWPQAPDYAAVAAAYPAKARAARLGGRATLNCEFTKEGRLAHCDTLTEQPEHQGFGAAAQTLAKAFQANPTMSDGKNIAGARVQLPVVFDPAMLDAGQPVIGKALWAALPSAEDTSAAFAKLVVTGTAHARLACVVMQGGSVTNCRVESEDPAGKGVGQAALSLSPHFRLTTWTAEGLPTVGGTINIPLRYEAGAKAPEG